MTESAERVRAAHLGPERRRPLVLDAAIRLFVEQGYDGTSMESIAEVAGVSKPVVYRCYSDKQALFRALLEREEARLRAAVIAAMPARVSPADTEATLSEALTALFEAAAEAPDSWRIIYDAEHGSEPAIRRRVERARASFVAQIAALVAPLLESLGVEQAERKSAVFSAAIAAIAETGVRSLLEAPGEWAPAELGGLLSRGIMRGPASL